MRQYNDHQCSPTTSLAGLINKLFHPQCHFGVGFSRGHFGEAVLDRLKGLTVKESVLYTMIVLVASTVKRKYLVES
jgi:hypothetical protein